MHDKIEITIEELEYLVFYFEFALTRKIVSNYIFVCDDTINPPSELDNGVVNILNFWQYITNPLTYYYFNYFIKSSDYQQIAKLVSERMLNDRR